MQLLTNKPVDIDESSNVKLILGWPYSVRNAGITVLKVTEKSIEIPIINFFVKP